VLRHLIVAMREAVVAPSPMMKEDKARSLTEKPADKPAERASDKPAERATTDAAA
jgi:small subunit ribosomal protein S6